MSPAEPILHQDARDAGVVPLVARDDGRLLRRGDGSDEEVRVSQALPLPLEQGLGLAEDLRRRLVEAEDGEGGEEAPHEGGVLLRGNGLGGAVVQLRGGNPGRPHFVVGRRASCDDGLVAAEDGDAGVGVEELQRSTSRPGVRSSMMRSASVASSTSDSHLPASFRHAAT